MLRNLGLVMVGILSLAATGCRTSDNCGDQACTDLGTADQSSPDLRMKDLASTPDLPVPPDLATPPDLTPEGDIPPPEWTAKPSGRATSDRLAAVWGTGPNNVYIAGYDAGSVGFILHYDGTGPWVAQSVGTPGALLAIWGSSATDIYAVGAKGTILHSTGNGTWTADTISPPPLGTPPGFTGVWGSGPKDVYVGGDTFVHSDGSGTFTAESIPSGAGTMLQVWGSSATNVYAVGYAYTTGFVPSILHKQGTGAWMAETAGAGTILQNAWGSGAGNVYIVGNGGTILHSTGTPTWTAQTTSTTDDRFSIWGSGANDIYIVGDKGSILHSTGTGTWTPQMTDSTLLFSSVWGSSASDIYVVGKSTVNGPTILHWPN